MIDRFAFKYIHIFNAVELTYMNEDIVMSDHQACAILQCRHNECVGVSNHQPHDSLLNLYSRRRSNKTLKLLVTGLCVGNSPVTGEFLAQMASNTENVSI